MRGRTICSASSQGARRVEAFWEASSLRASILVLPLLIAVAALGVLMALAVSKLSLPRTFTSPQQQSCGVCQAGCSEQVLRPHGVENEFSTWFFEMPFGQVCNFTRGQLAGLLWLLLVLRLSAAHLEEHARVNNLVGKVKRAQRVESFLTRNSRRCRWAER
jgi:hypothetical protein